jgi:hypothetical protein
MSATAFGRSALPLYFFRVIENAIITDRIITIARLMAVVFEIGSENDPAVLRRIDLL